VHNVIVAAAIMFAGIGGFIFGARAGVDLIRRMNGQLQASVKVMDAQSELILTLMAEIDPKIGAELRAKWEAHNA
jgi:hypothetical protein